MERAEAMIPHPPERRRARRVHRCITRAAAAAAMAAAMGILLSAANQVRLIGVFATGNAVLIQSSEPVAYSVQRLDRLTLVVELPGVAIANARKDLKRGGPLSDVLLEQGKATDGGAVARVRLSLTRPSEYRVSTARKTIRLEFTPARVEAGGEPLVLPPVRISAAAPAEREPALSLEEAIANAASITPDDSHMAAAPPSDALQSQRAITPRQAQLAAFAAGPPAGAAEKKGDAVEPQPQVIEPVQPPGPGQVPTGDPQKQYTGHPISLDFEGTDLRAVLRVFAETSGLNMVIDPDVQGTVDIVLTDVPWDQALEIILRANQLDYTVDGTIVRIARIKTLEEENRARQAASEAAAQRAALAGLAPETFTLSYAKAAAIAPLLKNSQLVSKHGQVQIDERTNTLIVVDLPDRFPAIRQLLGAIDRAEPQVEIEARIITTTREFARAIGVQWGLNGRMTPDIGNTTNLAFPNQGSLGGRLGTQGAAGSDPRASELEGAGTVLNLAVPGAQTAIGLALGAVNGAFNLDIALSALERTGKGRILSTPRVTTQNNVEAEITQGVQIPVQTVANNTVTVTFKDAALTLKVTPQITAANTVIMQITLENATPGTPVQGIPSIDTQRAITRVQVSDGMTTVMGGIFVSREQSTTDRTPVLHRVPLLGWLFRRDDTRDESRELLIFITPRILKG